MAFPLGRIGDTRVYIHITTILAGVVLLVSGYGLEVFILLGSLIMHETGHILGASFAGSVISRIDLWPFGAVGKVQNAFETEPRAEILTALGGPLTSAVLCSAASFVRLGLEKVGGFALSQGYPLLNLLIEANLGFFAMNLLPCLPLDGGRILRACLALKVGYARSSSRVSFYGRLVGALLTLVGLAGMFLQKDWYMLLVAGPLVFWGAYEEEENSSLDWLRELLRRSQRLRDGEILAVEEIMVPDTAKVSQVINRFKPSKYHVVLVVGKDMKIKGRLSETQILDAFYVGKVNLRMKDLIGEG